MDGSSTKETTLILELAPNGCLLDYIYLSGKFSEEISRYYF